MNEPFDLLTPSVPAPSPVPLAGGLITADLLCSRCAYNLRGLTPETRCPECGTPVARSLDGNWLRLADPTWLEKLKLGAALKLWGLLLSLVMGVAGVVIAATGLPIIVAFLLSLASGILGLAAIFCITSPEPTLGKAEDPVTLRKVVRLCAILGLVGSFIAQGLAGLFPAPTVMVIGYALSLAGVAAMFGEFVYLRRFARRIPDAKLAKTTTWVMWGFGSAMLAFVLIGILTAIVVTPLVLAAAAPPAGATAASPSVTAVTPTTPTGTTIVATSTAPRPTVTATGPAPATPSSPAGAPSASTVSATAPFTGPAAVPFALIGFFGCFAGLGFLVFGVLYISLLFRFYAAFKRAVAEAGQIARGERLAFPVSAPPLGSPTSDPTAPGP